ACGVFAGAPGQVVMTGDFFPEIDDGPDALEPFDFRLVLPGGDEGPAGPARVDREMTLAFLQAESGRLGSIHPARFDPSITAGIGDEVVIVGLLSEGYGFVGVFYEARRKAGA